MARIADHWWMLVARGLASFALAAVLLLGPGWSSLRTLSLALGIWALVDGAASLAFVLGVGKVRIGIYVGRGLLGIAVGALALTLPGKSTQTLYALMSMWAVGVGALEMTFASRRWFVLPQALGVMIVGAVSLAFGLSLLPFAGLGTALLRAFLLTFAVFNGVALTITGEKLQMPRASTPAPAAS